MYGARMHWPYDNFSGTDALGWNMVGGGSHNENSNSVPCHDYHPHPIRCHTGSATEKCLSWSPSQQESHLRAPIHKLWKCARAHKPSVPSLQPGKALKRAKKGGEKKLNASSLSTTFTSVQTSRTSMKV
ncbi:hypothetical protein B0H14DRAFT_2622448 [Mycena olivaceomarginata]|nr:hypothetical protein B0H14DRAFT_2622448 [Mycena olivaceomarginata]